MMTKEKAKETENMVIQILFVIYEKFITSKPTWEDNTWPEMIVLSKEKKAFSVTFHRFMDKKDECQ